ncbi:sterol desaturase family protein [Kordiimonas gwangyangensis]|uniref:sterol desaturase family protein n=1 Tax=Kordiimonas gwangyangensis TaxID=288022 RepID=UPI0003713C98|nr:sterol desaturase family protein [Kordiimonas gwangyangensis]
MPDMIMTGAAQMDPLMAKLDMLATHYAPWITFLEWATLVFVPLAIFEFGWDMMRATGRRVGETVANILVAVGYELSSLMTFGLVLFLTQGLIAPFALFEISMTPMMWVVAILLADFTYYWMHRAEHEVRLFWAYHVTHHSSPEYNLTTAFRLSWLEGVFEWLFFVPMLLVGFDALATFIALAVVASYQTWIHTQAIGKLGWFEGVINTPSAHRVHHGSNPKYLDKNYGGILLVWDRLFGTYEVEEEPVTFGITEPVESINPFVLNFHEFIAIGRDLVQARSLSEMARCLFAPPGTIVRGENVGLRKDRNAAHKR